jgi:energy-coupling factor transporter ATP-binding protein EcfA2
LAADGASILIAEQKTDLLAAICDRVVVIDAGHLAIDDAASKVLADPRLIGHGVAPPPAVRLQRAARDAALPDTVIRRLVEASAS